MVQQERARITRAKIIVGAAEVFERVGFGGASISDILDRAGVAKGALYFHFATKDEVARAVIERQHEIARAGSNAILATPRPAIEHMVLVSIDLAELLVSDPVVRAGIRLTTDTSAFDAPLRSPYEDWIDLFVVLATRARAEGWLADDVDPAVLARFIVPAFTGVQLVSELFTARVDIVDRVRELWWFLLRSVVPVDRRGEAEALLEGLVPRA